MESTIQMNIKKSNQKKRKRNNETQLDRYDSYLEYTEALLKKAEDEVEKAEKKLENVKVQMMETEVQKIDAETQLQKAKKELDEVEKKVIEIENNQEQKPVTRCLAGDENYYTEEQHLINTLPIGSVIDVATPNQLGSYQLKIVLDKNGERTTIIKTAYDDDYY
tara:strand:- start:190 stop:681 length:492 start_codon:yes stop_codon:yes gene_type:complete